MNLPGYDTWKLDTEPQDDGAPDPRDDDAPEPEDVELDAPEPQEDWLQDAPMLDEDGDLWGV